MYASLHKLSRIQPHIQDTLSLHDALPICIYIGQTFDRMSGSTSDPALLAPFPNRPSRSKGSILRYLPLVELGNPSLWITCQAFLLLSMETTVFSWLSTDSQRWPLWRPARRISQQKPLFNSFLNECGFNLGSHSLSYQITIAGSSTHFGPASGQCWTPSSPSPQLSIPKQMAKQRSST